MAGKHKLLLAIVIVVLIAIFTPAFVNLYEEWFGPVSYGFFWGPVNPENIEGFFMSYAFFATLLVTIFGGKKKYKVLSIAIGLLFLLDIGLAAWEALIINIAIAIIAWIIAQIILAIYRATKNRAIKKPKPQKLQK